MHGAVQVSDDGRLVYVSTELSNTLIAVPTDPATGSLGEIASVTSLLPEGYDGPPTTASHVELSPCGGFAYVGNRVGVDLDGVSPSRLPQCFVSQTRLSIACSFVALLNKERRGCGCRLLLSARGDRLLVRAVRTRRRA